MVGISFLVLQTRPGGPAEAAEAATAPSMRAAILPAPSNTRIVVHGLDFEAQAATISQSAPILDEAVQLLGEESAVVITVNQPIDRDSQRLLLVRRRAKAVRRYLIDNGVDAHRITLSTGAVAATPGGRATPNRPVELRVE
jgi:outer membrane protein OmpA-like peptidoglycan-associated protein